MRCHEVMTTKLLMSFAIIAVAMALSAAIISSTYAQQNQSGSNYSSSSNNNNMSSFPTRTTPGNITNTTAAENITITPAK
jgi:hypothetical protein